MRLGTALLTSIMTVALFVPMARSQTVYDGPGVYSTYGNQTYGPNGSNRDMAARFILRMALIQLMEIKHMGRQERIRPTAIRPMGRMDRLQVRMETLLTSILRMAHK